MRDERKQDQPVWWREVHPEAFAELKRTWGVIGHSTVLMVLSLSLIGTSLTIAYLHLPEWVERGVRLGASVAAVYCGSVALWRAVRALWRTLRAIIRTRRAGGADEGASRRASADAGTASWSARAAER
ncbi:hypothetical protein [Streptomyces sp. NPDC059949]|uniref:hypothetical protein n=1 Tax=Streptomyces sp. NPDC059949 TaxID=3347013 RepID=UPI0036550667